MLEKIPSVIGRVLQEARSGFDKLVYCGPEAKDAPESIVVESDGFTDHDPMPARYTADGPGISPPLRWRGAPAGTQALLLLVEDADGPTPQPLVHAIVAGLPAGDGALAEGALKSAAGPGDPALTLGKNSFGKCEYLPPDPPSGHGWHRYAFQLYALDNVPEITPGCEKPAVRKALDGHVLARGLLVGTYRRA